MNENANKLREALSRLLAVNMNITIRESSWHRNGVGGLGFYAILFEWTSEEPGDLEDEDKPALDRPERFLAILFDEPGSCAVLSLDRIEKCGVRFAEGNSWRGDRFEKDLRRLIEEHGTTSGVRIGPFGIG